MSVHNRARIKNKHSSSEQAGVSEWLRRAIVYCFHALVILTPLYFSFSTDELFEFNKMMLVYLFGIMVVALWISRMIISKNVLYRHHWFNWFLFAFLASQYISTLLSIHPYTSWLGYYSRFHGGLLSYLLYTLLYLVAISNLKRRELLPLLVTTLLSALLVSIYAIFEHFGYSVSCQLSTGQFNASCWVQDVQNRVFATFGQPNWLAAYALMLVPLALWLLGAKARNVWLHLFSLATLASLIWTIIYTKSRSGFFGLLLGVVLYLIGLLITAWWRRRSIAQSSTLSSVLPKQQLRTSMLSTSTTRWTLIGFGVIIFAILVSGSPVNASLWQLWSQRNSVTPTTSLPQQIADAPVVDRLVIGGTDSGEIRKIVWQGALDVWKRYPWFGSGPETFGYSYYLDRPVAHNLVSEWDFLYNKAHNEFLNFLATTGAVGLLAYLTMLVAGMVVYLRGFIGSLRQENSVQAMGFVALASGTAGLAVSNFFGFSTVMVTLLQFLFWAVAVIATSGSPEPHEENRHSQTLDWWQYASLTILSFLTFWLLLQWFNYYQADQLYASSQQHAQAGDVASALRLIHQASQHNPHEALYWDAMAQQLAQVAVLTTDTQQRTLLVTSAIEASDRAMALNPEQRNFYKSRARVFILLSQIDQSYYSEAIATLSEGITRSPTDAKLLYNRGLLLQETGEYEVALTDFSRAIELKPNYEAVLVILANHYAQEGDFKKATNLAEQIKQYNPFNPSADAMIASYSAGKLWTVSPD